METPNTDSKNEIITNICYICKEKYNTCSCKTNNKRTEVQGHGFTFEKEIICNIYGATVEELNKIKYTNKMDLPAELNRLDKCDISVKTTCNKNSLYGGCFTYI
jgi:hypothetical protein